MFFFKIIALASLVTSAFAAFGLTDDASTYVIDTDAGLTWTIRKSDGNIISMRYNDTEFQSSAKFSHINSGFGSSPVVTAETIGTDYVKVKIVPTTSTMPITHYYVAKRGDNVIYMATANTGEVDPGEFRMLFRLDRDAVPNGYTVDGVPVSTIIGGTAIEGQDVYLVDGTTRAKFYSSERFIDDKVHGVTGPTAGLWMVMPGTAYETSSGGPFMRDINMQQDAQHELYWYMNSGHIRTEPWRFGLHGPYALVFNNGTKPSEDLDTSFFDQLNIDGYVPLSGRGYVSGTTTGIPSEFETVLHWSNPQAQYWTKAVNGQYTSPAMKPGTYTVKLYRNEYLLETQSVVVSAGETVVKNHDYQPPQRNVIWKIGEFDGQPFEFKNGNKFLRMHPSDSRMSPWGGVYTVGTHNATDFPMAIFKDAAAGGKIEIQFYLTSAQIRDSTLRISTTLSFEGARPAISMPDFPTWKPSAPAAPVKIDSRGVTRGGYRGYGDEYTFGIAKGRLVAGAVNKIVIEAASGSSGAGFLSPNFIVDAIQFEGPAPATTTTTAAPTTTTTVAPTTTTTTTTTVAPTTTTTTTPALITTTASTVTVTDTVTASTTITETLPAISVTLTETLPAVSVTLTETLPAVSVTLTETQTLTETETLPAVTVTDTLTLPAETITQIQTETETTTLPAVTTTVTVTPSPIVCGHRYEQCGGVGWTGHKCCAPGTTCQYKNAYYSQCL